MRDLLNTKQVASYLGINEKKVYYLAKAGKLPCTRVTGKWLFPKKLVDEWIEENSRGALRQSRSEPRTFLLAAGSDDPSLGTLRDLYVSRRGPASLFMATTGSNGGLLALRDGVADCALAHLLDMESGEFNLPFARRTVSSPVAAVSLFRRRLGILVRAGNPLGLGAVADLARPGVRIVNRQPGSGTRHFLDQQLARLGLEAGAIGGYEDCVTTHLEAGLKVLRGEADAALSTETTARMLGLDFVPLVWERFDLLVPQERFFSRAIDALLEVVGSKEFLGALESMGGYDTSSSGRIVGRS